MTPEALASLRAMLKRHEGVRPTFYLDTLGIPTIGVGRNLRDKGLSSGEVDYLLDNDIVEVTQALERQFAWFAALDTPRALALIDMAFNVGPKGLLKSPKMLAAFATGDYQTAAREALAGPWAAQVGARADELAKIFRDGTL